VKDKGKGRYPYVLQDALRNGQDQRALAESSALGGSSAGRLGRGWCCAMRTWPVST
jgi:hypothetical protein